MEGKELTATAPGHPSVPPACIARKLASKPQRSGAKLSSWRPLKRPFEAAANLFRAPSELKLSARCCSSAPRTSLKSSQVPRVDHRVATNAGNQGGLLQGNLAHLATHPRTNDVIRVQACTCLDIANLADVLQPVHCTLGAMAKACSPETSRHLTQQIHLLFWILAQIPHETHRST